MDKLSELNTTQDIVLDILETFPDTRNSDNHLYYWVCVTVGKKKGIDVRSMSMPTFLLHLNEYGLPAFETVRRTRQKIQAAHPELASCANVEAERMSNEKAFKEYARG